MNVLPTCSSVYRVHVWYPQKLKEGAGCLWNWSYICFEHTTGPISSRRAASVISCWAIALSLLLVFSVVRQCLTSCPGGLWICDPAASASRTADKSASQSLAFYTILKAPLTFAPEGMSAKALCWMSSSATLHFMFWVSYWNRCSLIQVDWVARKSSTSKAQADAIVPLANVISGHQIQIFMLHKHLTDWASSPDQCFFFFIYNPTVQSRVI